MKQEDRIAYRNYLEYSKLYIETDYEVKMSKVEKERFLCNLEKEPIKWIKFFFAKYAKAEFAPFHTRFINRVINHDEHYEVLSWSRELAKSTTVMFAVLYLALTGRSKNIILTSYSYDNACRLLEPYKINLENNAKIKAFYGEQQQLGSWESGEFKTQWGAAFRALGAGQSPRGVRNEAMRPDTILVDDFDTDESVRNPDTVNKNWEWFEQALYPTRSISDPLRVIFCGNIIAKDCCIMRAGQHADNWDVVNIRDKHGVSSWVKNSEEDIDRVLSKISARSVQQEYFNNPLSEGDVFKELAWGECPPLSKLQSAIVYSDPAPANNDKQKKGSSFKSAFLIGYHEGKFYVYTGYLDQVLNSVFVGWFYELRDYVGSKTTVYNYIENNTLQNPFYEQVFVPIFQELGREKGYINLTPDARKKPDKAVRIEATLEPLIRTSRIVFNAKERGNPNMKRLEEQFQLFTMQGRFPSDGVDCIEGGVWILNQRIQTMSFNPVVAKRVRKGMY